MVIEKVDRDPYFEKLFSKLDSNLKEKVENCIAIRRSS